jgi:hypothetical protein
MRKEIKLIVTIALISVIFFLVWIGFNLTTTPKGTKEVLIPPSLEPWEVVPYYFCSCLEVKITNESGTLNFTDLRSINKHGLLEYGPISQIKELPSEFEIQTLVYLKNIEKSGLEKGYARLMDGEYKLKDGKVIIPKPELRRLYILKYNTTQDAEKSYDLVQAPEANFGGIKLKTERYEIHGMGVSIATKVFILKSGRLIIHFEGSEEISDDFIRRVIEGYAW